MCFIVSPGFVQIPTDAYVHKDLRRRLQVDSSLGAQAAFAFPAPHRNTYSFNVSHLAVVFE
jgi:hypothetical protein